MRAGRVQPVAGGSEGFERSASVVTASSETPLIFAPAPAGSELEDLCSEIMGGDGWSNQKLGNNRTTPSRDMLETCSAEDATWARDRAVVQSELVFKVDMFWKTIAYELLPLSLAVLLCTYLDGYQAARNRFAGVFVCIYLPFLDLAWLAYAAYFMMFYTDTLRLRRFEAIGFLFLPSIARAATLGVKYALYSDLLFSAEEDLSLHSKHYEKAGMQGRNQMSSYVSNMDGKQKDGLVRFLYASMLYANTDLSRSCLTFPVAKTRDVAAFYSKTIRVLRGVADFDKIFSEIDTDGSGDITLDELRTYMQKNDKSVSEEEVQARFAALDVNGDGKISREEFLDASKPDVEAGGGNGDEQARLNSHVFLNTQAGILQSILRQRNAGTELCLLRAQGSVPSSIVALNLVVSCSDVSATGDSHAKDIFTIVNLLINLALCFMGAIIRSMHGEAAFGVTWQEKVFFGAKLLPEFLWSAVLIWFSMAPVFWYYRQLLMAQRLLDLIDGKGAVDMRWNSAPTAKTAHTHTLPPLDLSEPGNIEGWTSIRRTIFGRNFAPAVELKFQFYVTMTLSLFLVSAAANALGSSSGTSQEQLPLDYVVVSILRPMVLSVGIITQIMLAFWLNRYAFCYAEALNASSLRCATRAYAISRAGENREEAERLQAASCMLAAAAAEIESEAESRPMRVIFVKAEPAAASMIISAIMSIIALQIYGMRGVV